MTHEEIIYEEDTNQDTTTQKYQLENDIINNTWYVSIYNDDPLTFNTFMVEDSHQSWLLEDVHNIVIMSGNEIELPVKIIDVVLENILCIYECGGEVRSISICSPLLNDDLLHDNEQAEKFWKDTLKAHWSELYNFCQEKNIDLGIEHFMNYFVRYSHKQLCEITTNHAGTHDPDSLDQHPMYLSATDTSLLTKSYLTYNGRERLHRTQLVDALRQNELWDKGVITYSWQTYCDSNDLPDPDAYPDWMFSDKLKVKDNSDHPDQNFVCSYEISQEFLSGFCHVVAETLCEGDDHDDTSNRMFVTEKTMMPIWFLRPFLILSNPGFHTKLKDHWDIELYDEIFDYSFDSETDRRKRIIGIIKNIKDLESRQSEWPALFEKILPKLKRNRDKMKAIATDIAEVPQYLIDQLYNPDHKIPTSLYAFPEHLDLLLNELPPNNFYTETSEPSTDYNRNNRYREQILERSALWDKTLHFFGANEWDPYIPDGFAKICNDHGLTGHGYWFSSQEYLDKCQSPEFCTPWQEGYGELWKVKDFHAHSYPTYHLTDRSYDCTRYLNTEPLSEDFIPDDINQDYGSICLLARPHAHRVYVLDTLYRQLGDQLEHHHGMKLSYNGPHYKPELTHFFTDPEILELRNLFKFIECDGWDEHLDSFKIPDCYNTAFCDFVTESTTLDTCYTEKLFKPINALKPYALLGAPNTTAYLKEKFGFEDYSEIIDYSYDSIEDDIERSRAFALELVRIANIDPNEIKGMYEILWPKLIYNRELFDKYKNEAKFPDQLAEIYAKLYTHGLKYNKAIHLHGSGYSPGETDFKNRILHYIEKSNHHDPSKPKK